MSQSLTHRVEQVQHAATRLTWLYGLARFATATLAAIIGLGLLDYLLRMHDPTARWLWSAAAAGLAMVAFAKLGWPAIRFRHSLLETARRIELHFPELGERLSSAIAFLEQTKEDRTAGSPDLRRAVVAEAEGLSVGLDFRAALDSRAPQRALYAAAAAIGIAALLAALHPSAAVLASFRLALPWRELPWPRRHELTFAATPQRLAKGDDLELVLVDRRGTLPDVAQLVLRYETPNGWRTETKEMKPFGNRMIYRLDNVTRGFDYRARGGDDDTMPWTTLDVVEPPKIVELQVLVEPPSYTGLPSQIEGRVLKALIGSSLRIRGRLDQPIRSAVLKTDTAELALPSVEIAADGRRFTAPAGNTTWNVERSGAFVFELTDQHGMIFGRDTRIELQAIQDAPPAIAWEAPVDHSFVTARAVVPVKGAVKDDLGVRSIQLRHLRPSKSDEEQVLDLYVGQAVHTTRNATNANASLTSRAENVPFSYRFELSHLAGLAPGDVLAIRLTAEDYKSQLATTSVRRLTIITDEELESRIATQQGAILGQLEEALRLARQGREQTQSLESRLPDLRQIAAGDLNLLQAAQHNLRRLQRLLADAPEGAAGQIVALLDELATNHIENQASAQRLTELLQRLRELTIGPIPAIDQELTEALKSASHPTPGEISQYLRNAGGRQDELVQSLEKLVGTLTEWDSFSRVAREVGQIRSDQERLAVDTDELRLKAVAVEADLPPADRAAARQLGQRELELARRLDKLQTRMEELLARLTAEDPLAAAALADSLDAARRLAIGGRMREAASRLAQTQLSQARQVEQEVLDALKQLLEALSTRRDYELARSLASLRQASTELHGIVQRTAKIEAELAGLSAQLPENRQRQLERLRRELEQVAQDAQKLARRLQRLQAPRAAAATAEAGSSGSAAAQAASGNNAAEAEQQAENARRRLEEAEEQLTQAIAQVEEELAREQLARVEQMIAGLAIRQRNALAETERLERLREADGRLDAVAQGSVRNIAAEQRLLADEADQLLPRLSAAATFRFALEGSSSQMRKASVFLLRGQTAAATQDAQRAALSRLEQILAALRADQQSPSDEAASPNQKPGPQQQISDLAGIKAELKLLQLLQQSINTRTQELEALRTNVGTLTSDQEQQLDLLAREQGRLAEIVLELIQANVPRPEDADLLPPLEKK
jgi:hypothetical protein